VIRCLLQIGFAVGAIAALVVLMPDRITGFAVWIVGIATASRHQLDESREYGWILEFAPLLFGIQGALDRLVGHLGDGLVLLAFSLVVGFARPAPFPRARVLQRQP
jgi:hypothetical protein